MAENMRLYLELMGKSGNLRSELNTSRRAVTGFTTGVKRELSALGNMARSVTGQLAAVGVGFSAVRIAADSARLDKSLTRTKQTAGATAREMAVLRKELFTMARQTGQPLENLQSGLDGLVASGLKLPAALESLKAINIGSAVTGAQPSTLSSGLTVAATAFNFDLSKPNLAVEMLSKMTVAGRMGNAELESLSDIISRIGVNGASAGMGFEQTLAFVEGLSLIEKNPERLSTLADSTLRLFNNMKYMKDAQKATGVRFFDAKGERRDAMAIIGDIKKQYDILKTDKDRAMFIQKAFGGADLDTQKGMKSFLQGTAITQVAAILQAVLVGGATLNNDVSEATRNLVDQVGMLKNDLREAADGFVKPMNSTLTDWIKWARESKEGGGAGLDGKSMVKYGAGGLIGGLAVARIVSLGAKRLLSGGADLATGVGMGKALEYGAGVTPVFVVNMPGSTIPGGGPVATGPGKTPLPFMMGSAGPAGVAVGTLVVGSMMVRDALDSSRDNSGLFEGYGSEQGSPGMWSGLVDAITRADREKYINLNITIDQNGRATTSSSDPNTGATVKLKRGSFGDTVQDLR